MNKTNKPVPEETLRILKAITPAFKVYVTKPTCDDCGAVLAKHQKKGWYYCRKCVND